MQCPVDVTESLDGAIAFLESFWSRYTVIPLVVSKRDDFVVDVLFYFETVQRFEYRGDMFSFWVSSYCTSKGGLQ